MIEKINNPLIKPVSPTERTKQTEEESEEQARKRRENELGKGNTSEKIPTEEGGTEKDSDGYKKIDIRV